MPRLFLKRTRLHDVLPNFFLDECSCKDCTELIESFKKAKEDPQSNIKAIIDYLLEDAQMNVRRAKLILASCEKSYSDICKLAWKNKE